MTITLCNIPDYSEGGCLWFIIPDELQPHVVSWVKSKLHEVTNSRHRRFYRGALTKASLADDEGRDIWWKCHIGNSTSVLYHREGEWRVGCRGVPLSIMPHVEHDFLYQLRAFAVYRILSNQTEVA